MAERKTGAGGMLSGVLERATPPSPVDEPEPTTDTPDPEPIAGKGRGLRVDRKPSPAKPTRKMKGRTIYLPDDLFERIMVQAHRRDKTISEYVAALLDRQVPDHRTVIRGEADDTA